MLAYVVAGAVCALAGLWCAGFFLGGPLRAHLTGRRYGHLGRLRGAAPRSSDADESRDE
jgi:hypothetical protein